MKPRLSSFSPVMLLSLTWLTLSFAHTYADTNTQYSNPATNSAAIGSNMRTPLQTSNMPDSPPPQAFRVDNALPGLSFTQPLGITTPPGETNRLFIMEKGGNIKVIPDLNAGSLVSHTFLALGDLVKSRSGESFLNFSELGLLGLAFHPNYASNGRFFVVYSVRTNGARYHRLSEFAVSSSNPNLADPNSEIIILQHFNESTNHNGGDLHFGPDGYLYKGWGDEGGSNDSLDNSQTITKDFWSSITRMDVDLEPEDYTAADGSGNDDANLRPNDHPAIMLDSSGNPYYEVPFDNPWVGASSFNEQNLPQGSVVRTEFWAVGLRNPWRMSFDPETGDLWCADLGQLSREEVNLIVRGGNYEWAFKEGTLDGPKWNQRPTGWTGANGPIYDYTRGSGPLEGNAVTGGVVYRGNQLPGLYGLYIFADYVSGNIWSLDASETPPVVTRLAGEGGIVSFGYDPSNGDVLMADINDGLIRRITAENQSSGFPQTLAETGLFQDTATLTPSPGLLPYDINLPFWSDHAIKQRWFGHPETSPTFTFKREGDWTHPTGTVWVKHFDLETVRGDPSTQKRIETRVLVKTESGAYGVSYRWNEAGTVATLADSAGEAFDIDIEVGSVIEQQRWIIPSQSDCRTCHTPQAGYALSFGTRQLNREGSIGTHTGNFISLLEEAGYLEGLDETPAALPRHVAPQEAEFSHEARVRSWLEVNCAYCHNPDGPLAITWDTRAATPLFETGLINGAVAGGVNDPADRLIVPGSHDHSVIVNRMAARNGYSRMPPLGTTEIDEAAVNLLDAWIQNQLPSRQSYAQWREANFGSSSNGAPSVDFDLDGRDNQSEYIAQTDPRVQDSPPATTISTSGQNLIITAPDLNARGIWLEESTDLERWEVIPMPGNNGQARPTGQPIEVEIIPGEDASFFRARIEER